MTPLNGAGTVLDWVAFCMAVLVFLLIFIKQVLEDYFEYETPNFWLKSIAGAAFYIAVARYVYLGIFHV